MSKPHNDTPHAVVDFWTQAGPKRWFAKDAAFDAAFRDTFNATHLQAARRELEGWLDSAQGALALLILLDQYPRNAFRGTAHMFATDPLARLYARRMVDAGLDQLIEPALRAFCYLPFEHSEDAQDQQRSLLLNQQLDANTYRWAKEHARIIERFGAFPTAMRCWPGRPRRRNGPFWSRAGLPVEALFRRGMPP